jgi:hypothetical protein
MSEIEFKNPYGDDKNIENETFFSLFTQITTLTHSLTCAAPKKCSALMKIIFISY